MVEAAGIEPASEEPSEKTSTSLAARFFLAGWLARDNRRSGQLD